MRTLKPLLICVVFTLVLSGCYGSSKKEVKKAISSELNLLKNLDTETTQKYISYSDLFSDEQQISDVADEISDIFVLFFQDFNYKIHEISISDDTASAQVTITTLDAKQIAADFKASLLKNKILSGNKEDSDSASAASGYAVMIDLLKNNEYQTVSNDYTLNLESKEDSWQLEQSYQTENSIVGGLVSYISDPYLLTPADTLDVYLSTIQSMNTDEMSNYLGIDSILTSDDEYKNAIAEELVSEVNSLFDYEITDSATNGNTASVTVSITTFDSDAIIDLYNEKADEYLETADAVIDGEEVRQEKLNQLLLQAIKDNDAVVSSDAVFHLSNDGVSWKLDDPSEELGSSIFGSLTTSPAETASE